MATNEDNSNSSVSDLDEIPLWKKELIQRRKNLSKTIGANIQMSYPNITTSSSSSVPSISSISKDSSATLATTAAVLINNTNTDENLIGNKLQQATTLPVSAIAITPTQTSTILTHSTLQSSSSLLGSGVVNNNYNTNNKPVTTTGHSPYIQTQSQTKIQTNNSIVTNTTIKPTTINKYHQFVANEVEKPFQLHSSNDSEHNVIVLDKNVVETPTSPINNSSSFINSKLIPITLCSNNNNNNQLTNNKTNINNNKKSTNLNENNFNNKKIIKEDKTAAVNMVAAQEMQQFDNNFDDSSEELKYGPGIVSKLRCRYLSLALRQTITKQRPSLNNMRRATSLNNLLDDNDEDDEDEHLMSDEQQKIWTSGNNQENIIQNNYQQNNKELHHGHIVSKVRTPDEYISPFQNNKYDEKRSRHIQRGNDSLKRARSVEALVKYDHKAWEKDIKKERLQLQRSAGAVKTANVTAVVPSPVDNNLLVNEIINGDLNNKENLVKIDSKIIEPITVTIEDKIVNGRERGAAKPKKMMPFLEETERPPPECVKTKLLLFEATANRRSRITPSTRGTDVAAKVATYKTIICQEKPSIVYPKPPLSPQKPIVKPRLISSQNTSPKKTDNKPIFGNLELKNTNLVSTTIPQSVTPKHPPSSPLIGNPTKKISITNDLQQSTLSNQQQQRQLSPLTIDLNYRSAKIDSPLCSNSPTLMSPLLTPTILKSTSSSTSSPFRTNSSILCPESPRILPDIIATRKPVYTINNSNNVNSMDSPMTQLSTKIKNLTIESPTTATTRHPQKLIKNDNNRTDDETDDWEEESIDDYDDDDDEEEDNDDNDNSKKKITKTALENISKAGTTTQFIFGPTHQQQQTTKNKSHLPGLFNGSGNINSSDIYVNQNDIHKKLNNTNDTTDINGRQIGIIRPLFAETKILKSPTSTINNFLINDSNINKLINNDNKDLTKLKENLVIKNLTTSSSSNLVPIPNQRQKENIIVIEKPVLTSREIEKNLINKEKNDEIIVNDLKINSNSISANKSSGSGNNIVVGYDITDNDQPKWGINSLRKKQQHINQQQQNTTMLFNFSDRKDVPDYIENDGLILRRKRELPKPGESGFVLIGDVSLETSTDPDDYWSMGPPSPCDIEFENGNIIIDGKSSIRNKIKDTKHKIRFDDSLTSTFEYPSETSLLEDSSDLETKAINGSGKILDRDIVIVGGNSNGSGSVGGVTSNQKLIGSPLGSVPLGSYTPIKASINTSFELGITRTQQQSPTSQSVTTTTSPGGGSTTIGTGITATQSSTNDTSIEQQNGGGGSETESLQYLKPVAWSEGTRATDLLF